MTARDTQLNQLRTFVNDNHHIVMKYHDRYYKCLTYCAKTKYRMIELLFLSALDAAGGAVPIDAKYQCLNNFRIKLSPLKKKDSLSFNVMAKLFFRDYHSPADIQRLSKYLIDSPDYPHLGNKKANLFIKELVVLGGSNIFHNFNMIDFLPHLQVPIDSVIRKVYWSLLRVPDKIDASHDEKIQDLAKQLFPDAPIYFDDLWFWGHFSFKKDQLLSKANIAMIYTDRYIEEAEMSGKNGLAQKLDEFIHIVAGERKLNQNITRSITLSNP